MFVVTVEPDKDGNDAALTTTLEEVLEEDMNLERRPDTRYGETLLAGMGELHFQISLDNVLRSVPLDIISSVPRASHC